MKTSRIIILISVNANCRTSRSILDVSNVTGTKEELPSCITIPPPLPSLIRRIDAAVSSDLLFIEHYTSCCRYLSPTLFILLHSCLLSRCCAVILTSLIFQFVHLLSLVLLFVRPTPLTIHSYYTVHQPFPLLLFHRRIIQPNCT